MGPTRKLTVKETSARREREVLEKDDNERELEKILFGNSAGFLDSLTTTAQSDQWSLSRLPEAQNEDEDEDNAAEGEDMEDVADDELFFLDAGTTDLPQDMMEDLRVEQREDQEDGQRRQVLWHDSDDDRLTVSLASNTRLRKLRDTEADDLVSGTEYIRRLRKHYERLHPVPEWVKYARKKRKTSHGDEDSESDSDVSVDGGSLSSSVQPLAEILRSTGPLTRQTEKTVPMTGTSRALKLRPEVIDIQRIKDIASSGPSSIDTIEFHPDHPLLLTAGPSSTINIYHISPSSQNPNPLVTSLHVKGTPITTATFAISAPLPASADSAETQIYFSARRRYFHTWSLKSGTLTKISRPLYQSRSATDSRKGRKNHEIPTTEHLVLSPNSAYVAIVANTGSSGGVVHLLSAATHQPISQVRVDSLNGIAEIVFYRDSSGFSVVGKNGEVSEYNIDERRVVARWTDEGAVGTTTMALGGEIKDAKSSCGITVLGNDRWVAIGSTSGVVSVYDRRVILQHFAALFKQGVDETGVAAGSVGTYRPKPMRSFDHLTTPVSHLHFSKDTVGQMLVMASRWKKDALKLVHLPSCTVYRNWPTDKTPLGRISSVAISGDGNYVAVGNEAGKVRLWQVRD